MKLFTTVVSAIDFSENSDSAFEYALTIAPFFNSSLAVLHVPYRKIMHPAEKTAASLIVPGTHGRSGLNRVLFGSTAELRCPASTLPGANRTFAEVRINRSA